MNSIKVDNLCAFLFNNIVNLKKKVIYNGVTIIKWIKDNDFYYCLLQSRLIDKYHNFAHSCDWVFGHFLSMNVFECL
jgi:hypothetical protein